MHFALSFLLSRHAAASFDKQLHLADLIGGLPWHFDLTSGIRSFGDKYHWHACGLCRNLCHKTRVNRFTNSVVAAPPFSTFRFKLIP